MQPLFSHPKTWASIAYNATLTATLGSAIQKKADTYEQCKIKLLFNFIFFYLLLQLPALLFLLYQQNYPGFLLAALPYPVLIAALLKLRCGIHTLRIGNLVAATTLITSMLSSLFNNIDITTQYGFMWLTSILLAYVTASRTTTALLVILLLAYLGVCSYFKINYINVYVFPAYTYFFRHVANPIFTGIDVLFLLGLLGSYYRSIVFLERRKTLHKQRLHADLLHQNLTRQFLLVKGLSRSGRQSDGNLELLDACFTEIEKQCESALEILQNGPSSANI
ncbi:hypothetical protein GA0116948_107105 [Chitinophaga costaii]|uniref:Uncharacterized protein n=1 Tax=Chitinophaga costaii TaxID=1335309 RepID=A0A1C4E5Q2_9BACT|nr:hypothetical protein [Chitinophaga costaii]PUZ24307.1 hypothetical protein DCM91_12815 [Chitinophaga costaii]SCC38928.1 hypothetical protein GA0116948_107105 [Chitinophaga costaii]